MCDDMSEGEYQYQMAMCDAAGEDTRPEPTVTIWVTKEGQRIHVKMMTDRHLVNTIKMLRRWASKARLTAAMEADSFSATTNGEMAELFASQDAERLYAMDDDDFIEMQVPTWERLLKEAEKRGLSDLLVTN